MLFATALSVTLAPVLMVLLIRGRIRAETKNPLNRLLIALYRPILSGALRVRWLTLGLAVVVVGFTAPIFSRLGAEFMPPLNEGTILYMPTTVPGLSIPESAKVLQVQDQLLMTFPEVERVFGKMGKAPTATDPAFCRHGRDHGHPQTGSAMAAWHDLGSVIRRDGCEAAHSWISEHLVDADSDPY